MTLALVTNDDGIDAPGLHVLARHAVDAGLDVTIAAPARQSSGASASIVAAEEHGHIAVEPRTITGLEGVPTYAVRGGPGLIALIAAHGAFGAPADLVLSGVNHGANIGRAILHSGTVGAALTGGLNGAWGIAVSLDVGMNPTTFHWETGAKAAIDVLPFLFGRPRGTVLNLNAPNAASHLGIAEASLAPFGIVQMSLKDHSSTRMRLAVEELPNTPEPGSDAQLLADGWVTLTGLDTVSQLPLGYAAHLQSARG